MEKLPLSKHLENIGSFVLSFALLVATVYGIGHVGKAVWQEIFPGPTLVECHAGEKGIYSGVAVDGVSSSWGSKTLTEWGTGQRIRIDSSATCVERVLSEKEVKQLRADK